MNRTLVVLLTTTSTVLGVCSTVADEQQLTETQVPLILAHYMPWYVAKPTSRVWGWHWTMNHFDPEKRNGSKREIASQHYPLIGPYDSGDPQVIEYHLLTMKLAGIDGVIVDWYGLQQFRDYPILHRNTQRLVEQIERHKMKFVICYEDQTIPALVEAGKLNADKRAGHAADEIQWLAKHWFPLESYVRLNNAPVLLSFGHAGLSNEEWTQCLNKVGLPVTYFSEHVRREAALGAFDWPVPQQGLSATDRFTKASRNWRSSIPVAYPRFHDIYKEAELHDGYGRVQDNGGDTFRISLNRAFEAKTALIQIATWNDWGEGTVIEPSVEFGYRDLEVVQRMRRTHVDTEFGPEPNDLQVPHRLLQLRRTGTQDPKELDEIANLIRTEELEQAKAQINGR